MSTHTRTQPAPADTSARLSAALPDAFSILSPGPWSLETIVGSRIPDVWDADGSLIATVFHSTVNRNGHRGTLNALAMTEARAMAETLHEFIVLGRSILATDMSRTPFPELTETTTKAEAILKRIGLLP